MNRKEVNTDAEYLLTHIRTEMYKRSDFEIRQILTAAVRKLGKLSELKTPEPEEAAE